MKKGEIIAGVIAAFVIIGIAGAAGGNDDESSKKEQKQEETQKGDNTKKAEKVYKIGDEIKVGDVTYKVNKVSSTETIGSEYVNTKAQNMFYIVDVTLTNNGNEALTVLSSFFKLKLGDKEYESDSGAAVYLSDDATIFEKVNPDSSLTGKIVFDITENVINDPNLQLQVQTGAWGTEKGIISLK